MSNNKNNDVLLIISYSNKRKNPDNPDDSDSDYTEPSDKETDSDYTEPKDEGSESESIDSEDLEDFIVPDKFFDNNDEYIITDDIYEEMYNNGMEKDDDYDDECIDQYYEDIKRERKNEKKRKRKRKKKEKLKNKNKKQKTEKIKAKDFCLNKSSHDKLNNLKDLIDILDHEDAKKEQKELLLALRDLNNMIGMKKLKEQIINQILFFIQDLHDPGSFLHTVITGSPGTGKTSVAYIISRIYRSLGFLSNDKVVKATRSELIGEYVGHTAPKTTKVLDSAKGGVIFIDEAYSLGSGNSDHDSFSKECIDTINEYLSVHSNDLICIIAGYHDQIKKCFFSQNEGLERRFPWRFQIDNYTPEELYEILLKQIKEKNWEIDVKKDIIVKYFSDYYDNFNGNGGDTLNLLEKCKIAHAKRIFVEKIEEKEIKKKLSNKEIIKKEPNKEIIKKEPNKEIIKKEPNKEIIKKEPNKEIIKKEPNKEITKIKVKMPTKTIKLPVSKKINEKDFTRGFINYIRTKSESDALFSNINIKNNVYMHIKSINDICEILDNILKTEDNYDIQKLSNTLKKINSLVGLKHIKERVMNQVLYFLQNKKIDTNDFLHFVITGSSGTGKTNIIKLLASLYKSLGIIKTETITKITRQNISSETIKESFGGILLIDELYLNQNYADFIGTLNKYLSEHSSKFICVIQGVQKNPNIYFKNENKVLDRRFPWKFHIKKFTKNELIDVFLSQCKKTDWKFDNDETKEYAKNCVSNNYYYFKNNGGSTQNLLHSCKLANSKRIFEKEYTKKTFCKKDIEEGLIMFLKNNDDTTNGLYT